MSMMHRYHQFIAIFLYSYLLLLGALITLCQRGYFYHNCLPTRRQRAGRRKQKAIQSLIGHRPTRVHRPPRPPSALQCIDIAPEEKCSTPPPARSARKTEIQFIDVVLLNARSVCNKASLVYEYIVSNNIDVLLITETWLNENSDTVLGQIVPTGYSYLRTDRMHNYNGGGILLIYKQNLKFKKIQYNDIPTTFECMECHLHNENRLVKFITIYHPPYSGKNKVTDKHFLEELHDFMLERSLELTDSEHTILLGDFNLHVNDPNDIYASEFLEMITSFNLTQRVEGPTHEKGNTLDLVINDPRDNLIKAISVESNHISDHSSIVLTLDLKKPRRPRKTIQYRETKCININRFKSDIIEANITKQIEDESSINVKFNKLNDALLAILDDHAPQKEKTITIRPNTRWFSHEILTLKHERREAEKTWRRTKLTIHKDIFHQIKNKTNQTIRKAKQDYIKSNIAQQKGNSKELFKILNSLVKHDSKSRSLPTRTCDLSLANEFADFFTTKIQVIRNDLDNLTVPDATTIHETKVIPIVLSNFTPTSPSEIIKVITDSPNKSCQLDPVPTWILKACADEVSTSIANLINHSFLNSKIPNLFKEAHVIPLLKKPTLDQECLKNFRPVSNLNFVSKVVEKIVAQRLKDHLQANNITIPFQSAYRSSHSTETALLRVLNDIICSLNGKNNVLLLLLDLSAAFDTIDHGTLLNRLERSFGISGPALLWLKGYLSDRFFRVKINETLSDPIRLEFGVPQGSVLGPLLFTLYTSPLPDLIAHHGLSYHLYADDSQLYITISPDNISESTTKIVNCVNDIKVWMTKNKLKLNQDKTELIVFKKRDAEFLLDDIKLGNFSIDRSSSVKNLGFYLDSKLTMNTHITKICQNVHFYLCKIGRLRNLLDTDSAKLLVHALITSRLDYCNSLLFGLPKKSIDRLQKLQNKSARLITKTKFRSNITPVLKSLHWLPVEMRTRFKMACIVYKCIHGQAPEYLMSLLSVYRPSRALRSARQIQLERTTPQNLLTSRAFVHAAPAVWNSLSTKTRNSPCLSTFKRNLKTELFIIAFD